MINITVGENERVSMPSKWNEITIEQYAKMVSWINHYKLNETTDTTAANHNPNNPSHKINDEKKALDNLKCSQEIFAYLTGMSKATVGRIDYSQMNTLIAQLSELLQSQEVMKTKMENKEIQVTDSFDLKGKTYYFPRVNLEETTFGDYIETQQLSVSNAESEAGRFGVMAEQMAILCKETNVDNTPDLIKKKTRMFEKLTMDVVWQFVFFLTRQTNMSMRNLATYSKMATEMATDMQPKIGTS
jgi:hypothetical protein